MLPEGLKKQLLSSGWIKFEPDFLNPAFAGTGYYEQEVFNLDFFMLRRDVFMVRNY